MYGHARSFIDDNQLTVFMDNIKRNILRHGRIIHGRRDKQGIFNAVFYFVGRRGNNVPIRSDLSVFDKAAQAGA